MLPPVVLRRTACQLVTVETVGRVKVLTLGRCVRLRRSREP